MYALNIASKKHPGFFSVSLRCLKCNISIQLYQKDGSSCSSPYLISNFTRHIKLCFTKISKTGVHSQFLHSFFGCSKKDNSSGEGVVTEVQAVSDSALINEELNVKLVSDDNKQPSSQVF